LTIDGVHVGKKLESEYQPVFPKPVALHGRLASGSIIVVVATDAPMEARQLRALALRAALGMGRTGLTSNVGSGDLFLAFSTSRVYHQTAGWEVKAPAGAPIDDEAAINALYGAADEATQAAIYDALFESKTMVGRDGNTMFGLPVERTLEMLRAR
jgi:D-aminopeptidase